MHQLHNGMMHVQYNPTNAMSSAAFGAASSSAAPAPSPVAANSNAAEEEEMSSHFRPTPLQHLSQVDTSSIRNPKLASALSSLRTAVSSRSSYIDTTAEYYDFLKAQNESVAKHGVTPPYFIEMIAKQNALKRSIPYEKVYLYTEREEEIRESGNLYRAHGQVPPADVVRRQIVPELLPITKSLKPNAASSKYYEKTVSSRELALNNGPLAPGSTVRTIYGLAEARRKSHYEQAALNNPLLTNTNRNEAYTQSHLQNSSSWNNLSSARGNARRNGTLLSSFPLAYASFVSTLDTWMNNTDLANRIRQKDSANFFTWVECFGYEMHDGEDSFKKLPADVKADLETQWKEFIWRGIFPQARCDVWNRQLKGDRLRVERDPENRRLKMVPLPGWRRLETDPPEDKIADSYVPGGSSYGRQPAPAAASSSAGVKPPALPMNLVPGMFPGMTMPSNPLVMQQMMMLYAMQMQALAAQQQLKTASGVVVNAGQQRDVVIDDQDTIDGDVTWVDNEKLDAQVEVLSDTSSIPDVDRPCPFLPVTVSKIGGKSIVYLLLYAHIERFVHSSALLWLAKYHFPESASHFTALCGASCSRERADHMYERHLTRPVRVMIERITWSLNLEKHEGVKIEAVTGVNGSYYRLTRLPGFVRPSGVMALGDRLMSTLRVPVAAPSSSSSNAAAAPTAPTQSQHQQSPDMLSASSAVANHMTNDANVHHSLTHASMDTDTTPAMPISSSSSSAMPTLQNLDNGGLFNDETFSSNLDTNMYHDDTFMH